VKVELVHVPLSENVSQEVVWVAHNFGFLGGSLGCAEGEKLTRAFEYALEHKLPVCVQCRSGGARMQEGTSSLMQMAKVSVAVQALQSAGLPFISVLCDPTYGGVSASYAMQADVRIAVVEETSEARIGFAGPAVILNTMCEANQSLFDTQCPNDFQSASFVLQSGQVDLLLTSGKSDVQKNIELKVGQIANLILSKPSLEYITNVFSSVESVLEEMKREVPADEAAAAQKFNYTRSRLIDRPQTQDMIFNLFSNFVELR
jgi:acetyl-CoA carboxylase beta subunit